MVSFLTAHRESGPRPGYSYILLYGEFEQRFTRDLHLIAFGNNFRTRAGASPDSCANARAFAAAGDCTNDGPDGCSADCSLCGACGARLAFDLILSGHQ